VPPSASTIAFIVGVPRSGTTLLRVVLDSHADIFAPPETPWVLGAYGPDSSLRGLIQNLAEGSYGPVRNISGIDRMHVMEAGRRFLHDLFAPAMAARGKRVLVLKTPHDIRHLEFIAEFLPDARFLHITRDGRDVCLSQLAKKGTFFHDLKEFGRLDYANAFRRWVEWERKARIILARPGVRASHVRYEDLVADPARELERLVGFLDLPFDAAMLDYAQAAHDYPAWEAGSTDVAARKSISTNSVGAWRGRPMTAEMRHVLRRHEEALVAFGYAPSAMPGGLSARLAEAMFSTFVRPALKMFEAVRIQLRSWKAARP
jgi:hypothetical protein